MWCTEPMLYQENLKAQADALEQELKSVEDKRNKILGHVKVHAIKEQLKETIAKQMQ